MSRKLKKELKERFSSEGELDDSLVTECAYTFLLQTMIKHMF
jgi:hypothetical protein